jgi:predicted transposase YbfD/YdcC
MHPRRGIQSCTWSAPGLRAIAWCSRQLKVAEKPNEITAVPELLRLRESKGCLVTVDALNTQKETVQEIREQSADYVCALKENHPILHAEIKVIFQAVREDENADGSISVTEIIEKNHGRRETRRC